MQFRLNYAFTPDLTLEVYGEPFASSGRYHRHGELESPGSRRLITYGEDDGTTIERNEDGSRTVVFGDSSFDMDDADFHVLSFRSNVVLRWEWRPGSTLYLVWQRNRETDEGHGGRVGGGDLWESFSSGGENFLAVKASYWFGLD